MKGKRNLYTCRSCGHKVLTIDLDEGTTPMIISCKNKINGGKHDCNGSAFSAWYNIPERYQHMDPDMEWYKPSGEELKKLKGATKEHVQQGGLLMRKFTKQ